ncbi:MAG: hypothetical protein K6G42_09810 [Lachnospiraceae bacterium]|nr:hypothetical protein [Lachnospiraceae bacterium]
MNNYLIETRLMEEDEALHKRVDDCKVVLRHLLDSFQTWFPHFTDHSIMHSTGVLEFCNLILRQQVYSLSLIECYVLAMSCYLHDVGMGVTRENFESFTKEIDLDSYLRRFPDADETRIIRDFHHEFSGKFINKYADLFDIPDEDVRFAIVQVSRGHRKTDLYDEKEYPDMNTSHGVIRTGMLAAVLPDRR